MAGDDDQAGFATQAWIEAGSDGAQPVRHELASGDVGSERKRRARELSEQGTLGGLVEVASDDLVGQKLH